MSSALTDEQSHAVTRRTESLLLSAAAGSGKTTVLVERFVAAVREDGIAPAKILAITFTERAAGELRSRVRARLLELGEREAARDTEGAFVGTFHGLCARLLRAHALAAGLDPEFAIIDEALAARLREIAFQSAMRDLLADGRQDAVDLLAAYSVDRVRAMIEQVYAELRSRGQRMPRLPLVSVPVSADVGEQASRDRQAAAACSLLDELLRGHGLAYERLKHMRTALDFDDLELLARELLLERADVRAAWSDRFELLMVDEFQDTNARQLDILRALDHGNLFTVGDALQSIYGFRHADVGLFRARRDELATRGASLRLTHNFRARAPLLHAINAVFGERLRDFTPLAPTRASDAREPEVELLLSDVRGWDRSQALADAIAAGLPRSQLWRQAEARLLAQRIAELVDGGHAQAGEVVVLLRASGDLDVFERALQLSGLPTIAAVGAFWGHQQIVDLVCYLRALANPLDELALHGALASPLAGCSRDCLALLADAARSARTGLWQAALRALDGEPADRVELSPGDRAALASFCAWLRDERAGAARRTISELIERAVAERGYREHVLGLEWGERRLANVHKLLRLARSFQASEGRELRGFLDHVQRLQDALAVEADAPVEDVESDAVRLMTIHAAKGLEFPVVCVADLGRQPNTQTPDLLVDDARVGLRLARLDGEPSTPALDYAQLCEERRQREAEEEDRILYVAMTRARERLLLSGAIDFERLSQAGVGAPASRPVAAAISWLAPALAGDLSALAAAGDLAVHELPAGAHGEVTVRCLLSSAASVGTVLRVADAPAPGEAAAEVKDAPAPADVAAGVNAAPATPSILVARRVHAAREPLVGEQLALSIEGARTAPEIALANLSYTSLSELDRCGYRYYLERVLGLREDRSGLRGGSEQGGVLEARARGTLIHRLMESLDLARPSVPSPEQIARVARGLGMRVGEDEREQIARLIETAIAAEPPARVARARSVRREHPFAFSLAQGQPLIAGVIDLLAEEESGAFVVLDYKTDRVEGVDLGSLVDREYDLQRLLYALAVLRDGAPSVEVVHWFLERPHEPVAVSYGGGERPALEARLSAHVRAARARGFSVSPNPHRGLCLTCPGRVGLCSWGERETLQELAGEASESRKN
jgi:ATP-dependent helicase/nuclease subunit A